MDTQKRLELIKRNTEEIITEDRLKELLKSGKKIRHYIGFEISGFVHLGTGLASMHKVADFQKAGVECIIFLADWHSWINNKLGGDLEVIKKVAVGYFKEAMKISLKCVGGNPNKVKFVLGSDLYHNNDDYWRKVIKISKNLTLSRVKRSITIMGRKLGGEMPFAWLIYPPMQAADIFALNVNLAHAGIDQRSAHVIAIESANKIKKEKPIAIHHHLLLGAQKPKTWPVKDIKEILSEIKMSKSIPKTAIFIHDSSEEIKNKVKNAFCPEREVGFNPVLDWTEWLIFPILDKIKIERPKKFGETIIFDNYKKLEKEYASGKIHPLDLKNAVADSLIKILEPARKHFFKPKIRKMKEQLEKLRVNH
ncbi:MAG: tyrosine--tRNA ligase [Candidatus Pacearchaeota archaeon]|nr:MAG: tyrosine--tRNA ligase [Candidatus Pacearchaeota archaeon]